MKEIIEIKKIIRKEKKFSSRYAAIRKGRIKVWKNREKNFCVEFQTFFLSSPKPDKEIKTSEKNLLRKKNCVKTRWEFLETDYKMKTVSGI